MTYDLFSYNGEDEILDIRFNILDEHVDRFIIVEGTHTFSGNPKPLYFSLERFSKWAHKIIYYVVDSYDNEEVKAQIQDRIDYVNEPAFKRAFYQKEMLRVILSNINIDDEDIIYYGDVDQIWKPQEIDDKVYKLRQLAYSYYLNNRSSEDWRGTIITKWKNLKNGCLNDMRAKPENILEDGGWHFTNMGGLAEIQRKVASYDHQEVNIPIVVNGLQDRLAENVDFLGRGFKMWIDDSELPQYILDNKDLWIQKGLWKS